MTKSLAPFASLARRSFLRAAAALALVVLGIPAALADEGGRGNQKWVASWAASAHGLYPSGTAVSQPDLSFAFPSADTGANDQTFRLIVRPNLWGDRFRLRFSNFFGTKAATLDDVFLGLQASAGSIVPGTNHPVTFARGRTVTIPAGQSVFSDAVELEFVDEVEKFSLEGRKLAVSFHVVGTSGPMTWHSKGVRPRTSPIPVRARTAKTRATLRSPTRPPPGTSWMRSTSWRPRIPSSSPRSGTPSRTGPPPRSMATIDGPTCCSAACAPRTATASRS